MRKVGGNAERAIKECVVLCSVTVACSTSSVIATAALHILLTESLNRGNAQVSFLQNSYGLAECSTKQSGLGPVQQLFVLAEVAASLSS